MAEKSETKKKTNPTREMIVDEFTKSLEDGEIPLWERSWRKSGRKSAFQNRNLNSGKQYRGINQFVLELAAQKRGYRSPEWMTFKQMTSKGYHFRKTEEGVSMGKSAGVPLELYKPYDRKTKKNISFAEYDKIMNSDNEDRKKDVYIVIRNYYVFNADLVQELYKEPEKDETQQISRDDIDRVCRRADAVLDRYAQNEGILITENPGDQQAYYSPSDDSINLPPYETFDDPESFIATKAHEIAHSTGEQGRCPRTDTGRHSQHESYALEELRAEIGATFVSADLGIDPKGAYTDNMDNHKAYVEGWLHAIKDKPNELFSAIRDASRISDYVLDRGEKEKIFEQFAEKEKQETPSGRKEIKAAEAEKTKAPEHELTEK